MDVGFPSIWFSTK